MAHTSKLAMRGVALFGASVMALGLGMFGRQVGFFVWRLRWTGHR